MKSRAELEKEIARLQAELAALPDDPPEPTEEPAVLLFSKSFGKTGKSAKTYTYTAVRVGGLWHVSTNAPGRRPGPKTWADLVDYIGQAEKEMPQIFLARNLEEITGRIAAEK